MWWEWGGVGGRGALVQARRRSRSRSLVRLSALHRGAGLGRAFASRTSPQGAGRRRGAGDPGGDGRRRAGAGRRRGGHRLRGPDPVRGPDLSLCIRVSLSESLYPSLFIRVSLSESVSESLTWIWTSISHGRSIGGRPVAESKHASRWIRVAGSKSPYPSRTV